MASSSNHPPKDDLTGGTSEEDRTGGTSEQDLAQVWKELQKGEKTAQVLEANLTSLEAKLDSLLASFEDSERRMVQEANGKKPDEGAAGEEHGPVDKKGGEGGNVNS
ncbi:hypothetical protein D0Z07_2385 [Hyphodiscus hymeniophilus]|uniref:Uncharacterized protein n=1 Tax=Hyphodiscus hymeniophilus TaxID=353542 RepID=A0A9P6VN15_9HELO|nr:hypothetical protein D0Z07_2385 [Hyphodiscus hymeniophilus]